MEKKMKKWKMKTPNDIKRKSNSEQSKQITNILFFLRPCSITNIFWAPNAKIKLKPVTKPSNKKLIYYFKIFENLVYSVIIWFLENY